jgi:FkbM family methyltransferase
MKSVFVRLLSALRPLSFIRLRQWPRFLAYRRGLGQGDAAFYVREIDRSLLCRAGTTDATTLELIFCLRSHLPPEGVPPPEVIVDLGANVGFASAHFRHLYPEAVIVAVELNPDNVDYAARNLASARCDLVNAAIWTNNGSVRWNGTTKDAFKVAADGSHSVEAVTIDKLLDDRGLQRANFVKMDVEGAEWQLLHKPGFLDRIDSIVIEVHEPEWMVALAEVLEQNGLIATVSAVDPSRLTGVRRSI